VPLLLLALVAALAALAAAAGPAQVIILPGATSAEGIAGGGGATLYAGDLFAGDIFRGNLQRGTAERFIADPSPPSGSASDEPTSRQNDGALSRR
jgi:hypothetical protein